MNQRYDDELPPLTPAQQAETLRLAARLQAEHETRSASEALLRAAEEAGIDPRFVRVAASQVASGARPVVRSAGLPRPLLVVVALGIVNGLAILAQASTSAGITAPLPILAAMLLIAGVGALWAGRERAVRWATPLAVCVVWFALGVPRILFMKSQYGYVPSGIFALVFLMGALQLIAALVGALIAGYEIRSYKPQSL